MSDELLEALQGPPPRDKRTKCYVQTWLNELTPERREAFTKALDLSSKWKTTDIYELARKAGYEKQYNTLRMHRSGSCSCG